jgi:hypothetical protein
MIRRLEVSTECRKFLRRRLGISAREAQTSSLPTLIRAQDIRTLIWRQICGAIRDETQNNGIDDDGNGFVDDYYGYDFFANDSDPLDEHGHGTHTAGTIGAVGNNNLGVTGVNWNVRLMTIKIYDASGDSTSAILINAYNYVRLMKNRGAKYSRYQQQLRRL